MKTIRPFQPTDMTGVVAVKNLANPDAPTTVEELEWEDSFRPPECVLRRFVAVDAEGRVLGFGQWGHDAGAYHPRRLLVDGAVHPDARRRGVGAALFDAVRADLESVVAPESLTTGTQASSPETVRFLERRGFVEVQRHVQSRLDLTRFDPAPFKHVESDLAARGIRLVRLDDLAQDAGWDRKLYELAIAVAEDAPKEGEYTPPTFEQFLLYANNPAFLRDGCFVAVRDGAYVGLCFLLNTSQPGVVESGFTGTHASARGAGLGYGLRVRMVLHAHERQFKEMTSTVEANNARAHRLNDGLGFVAKSAWLVMKWTAERAAT